MGPLDASPASNGPYRTGWCRWRQARAELPAGADGHTMEVDEVLSSDEALVDIGAVEPGPADRAPVWVAADGRVGPVEVPRAGRYRVGEGSAGDELLVHPGAVELGPADRVVVLVGPVDVAGVDG